MYEHRPPEPFATRLQETAVPIAALGVLAGQMAERLAEVLYGGRKTPEYDLKTTGIIHATYFREAVVAWAHAHPDSGLKVEPVDHASEWARLHFEDRPMWACRRRDRTLPPGRRYDGLGDSFDYDDTAWAPGVERLPSLEMLSPGDDPGLAPIVIVLKRENGRYATARVFSPQGEMGTHFDYTVSADKIDAQIREWTNDQQAAWIERIRRGFAVAAAAPALDTTPATPVKARAEEAFEPQFDASQITPPPTTDGDDEEQAQ